jgi:hypothetical protein
MRNKSLRPSYKEFHLDFLYQNKNKLEKKKIQLVFVKIGV